MESIGSKTSTFFKMNMHDHENADRNGELLDVILEHNSVDPANFELLFKFTLSAVVEHY